MKQQVAYELKPGERNDVVLDVGHKNFRLAEISAKILNKIRVVAQDYLGEKVTRAVVTVPAYFTDRQRQAVKDAGKMIQLEVVRIINEPTAASLAYGIGKNLHETVVIYDLGGGTFDVSIIEIRDRVFEVKATGGDIFLGGLDFDQAMIEYVLRDFVENHGIDLSSDPVAMQRIKDLAERVKIDLSSREQAPFSVPFVTMTPQGQPLNIEFTFTRAMLEEITGDLIDRTVDILMRVMNDASLDPKRVDELLLVGGQTRMPAVQKRLTEIFGKTPSKGVHPDEAVAIGAALYANSLEDNSNLRLQLLDVIPMAIGLEKAGGSSTPSFPAMRPFRTPGPSRRPPATTARPKWRCASSRATTRTFRTTSCSATSSSAGSSPDRPERRASRSPSTRTSRASSPCLRGTWRPASRGRPPSASLSIDAGCGGDPRRRAGRRSARASGAERVLPAARSRTRARGAKKMEPAPAAARSAAGAGRRAARPHELRIRAFGAAGASLSRSAGRIRDAGRPLFTPPCPGADRPEEGRDRTGVGSRQAGRDPRAGRRASPRALAGEAGAAGWARAALSHAHAFRAQRHRAAGEDAAPAVLLGPARCSRAHPIRPRSRAAL